MPNRNKIIIFFNLCKYNFGHIKNIVKINYLKNSSYNVLMVK